MQRDYRYVYSIHLIGEQTYEKRAFTNSFVKCEPRGLPRLAGYCTYWIINQEQGTFIWTPLYLLSSYPPYVQLQRHAALNVYAGESSLMRILKERRTSFVSSE